MTSVPTRREKLLLPLEEWQSIFSHRFHQIRFILRKQNYPSPKFRTADRKPA